MNFRVNSIVALAAVFSFACADKQAANPVLEEALRAPPGARVVGLYEVTLSPVETAEGVSYAIEAVPVDKDGLVTNPQAQSVTVTGALGAVTTAATLDGCNGFRHVYATMTITNHTADALTNVWADVVSTSLAGRDACNSDPFTAGAPPYDYSAADELQGIWKYPDMAGTSVTDGSVPGGSGVKTWGFKVPSGLPGRFYFRVMAQPSLPVPFFADFATPRSPLTWTSTVATTRFEFCPVSPGLGTDSALTPCPVAPTVAVKTGVANGVGGFDFSHDPALANGGGGYWRVGNVYPVTAPVVGTRPSLFFTPWSTFRYFAGGPVVNSVTVKANKVLDLTASTFVTWKSNFVVQNTYAYVCAGACPNPLPDPAALNQLNVLFQGAVIGELGAGVTNYLLDVTGIIPVDALGAYYDSSTTYQVLVFDFDSFHQPVDATLGSAGTITVTPVQALPVITSPAGGDIPANAVVFSHRTPPWLVRWTADNAFNTTLVDVCSPDCTLAPAGPGNEWTPPGGLVVPRPPTGVYQIDLRPYLTDPRLAIVPMVSGDTFEIVVYNPDLYQVVGTSFFGSIL